jgi:hypothetical protein
MKQKCQHLQFMNVKKVIKMGKMKNIHVEMKNQNWKGSPFEFLKIYLKKKENDRITKNNSKGFKKVS